MATYSSVLAWRIPGTGEPGGLHRVGHDWSGLAAAAAAASCQRLSATTVSNTTHCRKRELLHTCSAHRLGSGGFFLSCSSLLFSFCFQLSSLSVLLYSSFLITGAVHLSRYISLLHPPRDLLFQTWLLHSAGLSTTHRKQAHDTCQIWITYLLENSDGRPKSSTHYHNARVLTALFISRVWSAGFHYPCLFIFSFPLLQYPRQGVQRSKC